MERISLETRREILDLKLRGYSNREAAEETGVSKGTVANVLEEVRAGQLAPVEGLESRIDALLELAGRVDDADLSVAEAHLGLDVIAHIDELGIEPGQVAAFRDRLAELADGEIPLEEYGQAAVRLRAVERATGYRFDGAIEAVLDLLEAQGEAEIDQLVAAASKAQELGVSGSQVGEAIEEAVRIQEKGMSSELAEQMIDELVAIDDGNPEAAIAGLRERYEQYSSLEAGIEELRDTEASLQADIEELRAERADLEADRDQLRDSLTRLDQALTTHGETLEELESTGLRLEEELDRRQSRLEEVETAVEDAEADLEAIEKERRVVHAYRRFLHDGEVSETLLTDLDTLLGIRDGKFEPEPDYREIIEDKVETELVRQANEMLEGEPMMPVAEHERKLQAAIEADRTLEELERERDGVLAFYEFLDTGDLPEDLLKDLYNMSRGWDSQEVGKQRKTEDVREVLLEELKAFTEDVEVVGRTRHVEVLQEQRGRYLDVISEVYESLDILNDRLLTLQERFDDKWMSRVAEEVAESLETADGPQVEAVRNAIEGAMAGEIQDRVEQECEARVRERLRKLSGQGVGLGSSFLPASGDADQGS